MPNLEDYRRITEEIDNIKIQSQWENKVDQTPYLISNLKKLRNSLLNIRDIKYISELIQNGIERSWLFETNSDSLRVSSSQHSELINLLNNVVIRLSLLKEMIEDSAFFNQEDLLFIHIPELQSFDILQKFSNDLKKAIEIPITNEDINGDIEIVGAEKGSIILYVALGSLFAVKLIASICWAAAVIRKKTAEAKIFEQHARTLELKNDSIENIVDAQKTQIKNIIDSEARSIASQHYSHQDPETIERLKLSLWTLSELIEKGVKILPNSNNEEIQKSFPDYSKLSLIESTIKQITESKI